MIMKFFPVISFTVAADILLFVAVVTIAAHNLLSALMNRMQSAQQKWIATMRLMFIHIVIVFVYIKCVWVSMVVVHKKKLHTNIARFTNIMLMMIDIIIHAYTHPTISLFNSFFLYFFNGSHILTHSLVAR